MKRASNPRNFLLFGVEMLIAGALLAAGPAMPVAAAQSAPDNTRTNKGDTQKGVPTADQQKMNPTDREITRKIRAKIVGDKSLSTYAHNVKIITQDGKVTLKGPVRTEDEKAKVEAVAVTVAGSTNVSNEIDIAPPKS